MANKKVVFESICREISRLYYGPQGLDPEELWQDKEQACRVTVIGMLIILVTSVSVPTLVVLRLVTVVHPWAYLVAVMAAIGVAGLAYVSIRQFLYLTRWHIGASSEEVCLVKKWGRIRSRMSKHVVVQRLISEAVAGSATAITACRSWTTTLRIFEEIRRRS